jgi:hypothetical protein
MDRKQNSPTFEVLEVFRVYRPILVRYKPNGRGKEVARFGPGFELASSILFTPGGELAFTEYSEDENGFGFWVTGTIRGR